MSGVEVADLSETTSYAEYCATPPSASYLPSRSGAATGLLRAPMKVAGGRPLPTGSLLSTLDLI
jgi:hypothetical protein